nr:hypothetical protein [uncultured Methanoregula sp.]
MEFFSNSDPCPCESEKVIGECCGKSPLGKFFVGYPRYDETVLLRNFIEKYVPFQKFYSEERQKIKKYIVWRGQSDTLRLEPGIGANNKIHRYTGLSIITLKNFPPTTIMDAHMIAHEMGHIIQYFEGMPALVSTGQYEFIQRRIGGIFSDLVIDEKLEQYGFDVVDAYSKEYENSRKQITRMKERSLNSNNSIVTLFNYVDHLLSYNRFFNKTLRRPAFFLAFEVRCPSLAKEGRDLVSEIESKGYDTPEKIRTLYSGILRKYGLEDVISISDITSDFYVRHRSLLDD